MQLQNQEMSKTDFCSGFYQQIKNCFQKKLNAQTNFINEATKSQAMKSLLAGPPADQHRAEERI